MQPTARNKWLGWTSVVLIGGLLLLAPASARAGLTPVKAAGWGPYCYNTSVLDPSRVTPIFDKLVWLDTALKGAGFTAEAGWTFRYADATGKDFSLANSLTITDYFAWVVDEPKVKGGDGNTYGGRYQDVDRGGAVFGVTYTPGNGNPDNIHWVQAINSRYGTEVTTRLDNPSAHGTPWYDDGGAAENTWYLDIPSTPCKDCGPGCCDYSSDVDFELWVAVDNLVEGKHVVDLYEGYWWGYDYACTVPEPAGAVLVVIGLMLCARMREQGRA